MSLSGNLANFSLDEVVLLLARMGKSGALRVRDARTDGVVYLADGRLCGAEVDQVSGPVDGVDALEARLVDACFALARLDGGTFEFEVDRRAAWPTAEGVEVEPVVQRVRSLLDQWPSAERFVGSVDAVPTLAPALAADTITLDRAGWSVLAAVDGASTVRAVGSRLGRSALEVAVALAGLIEAGGVTVAGVTGVTGVTRVDELAAAETAAVEIEGHVAEIEGEVEPDVESPTASHVEIDAAFDDVPEADEPLAMVDGDEPIEAVVAAEEATMATQGPEALARLNRAELERAALGQPIEEPDPAEAVAADVDVADAEEPRPAVTRDRGALLRMFSSLRDG